MTDNTIPTPGEKFAELVESYATTGVTPLEAWDTWDLLELKDAISAELQERDREAQEQYYNEMDGFAMNVDDSYGGTD